MTGQVFGHWDAPITDEDIPIDPPVGAVCIWCQEEIQAGDNGRRISSTHIEHRECSFRNVMGGIGHCVDHARYCCSDLGPDAGLSRRQSAIMVWDFYQETRMLKPSTDQLAKWRKLVDEARDKVR